MSRHNPYYFDGASLPTLLRSVATIRRATPEAVARAAAQPHTVTGWLLAWWRGAR